MSFGLTKFAFKSALAVLIFLGLSSISYAQQKVALELVLAIDASTSVDEREFDLQRTGLARAFQSKTVKSAIASLGTEGLAVSVVQWAGENAQHLAVPWSFIRSENSADMFAGRLLKMERKVSGFTDIAGAITFSTRQLLANEYRGARLAIDVSGDGTSDRNDPAIARDIALAEGITINGLVIFSDEHDLGDLAKFSLREHYQTKVIGGPGAFLLEAERFKDFARAIEMKLVREISGAAFVFRSNSNTSR